MSVGAHTVAKPGTEVSLLAGLIKYVKRDETTPPFTTVSPPLKLIERDYILRVATYSGAFEINAWANDERPETKFWTKALFASPSRAPFDTFSIAANWVSKCYADRGCANNAHEHLGGIILNNRGKPIDDQYQAAFAAWWEKVEPTIDWRPQRPPLETTLNSLLTSGKNTLGFQVFPKSTEWSVTVELVRLHPTTQQMELVRSYSMRSPGSDSKADQTSPTIFNDLVFEK